MINVLDKNVAELIAAGEVIERPVSVIKELLENSIDAGAKNITVEIMRGGIAYMRVTDDGAGIEPDDVRRAFFRHATSKISTAADLWSIGTMGFRGEALASISAVSRVELLTKPHGSELGMAYRVEGGEEKYLRQTGCPDGTTFIIRDLFFNTPARLKFLRRDQTEGSQVVSLVEKLALIHPEISFKLIRDNKPVMFTGGDGKQFSAIRSVLGKQFACSLIPVEYSQGGISVNGYVSSPLFPSHNRSSQYFYVNKRYIKSLSCMNAVEEACKGSIMVGKFPAAVLDITMPPSDVDVNVHPAKTEVRFANDRAVHEVVYFAVKNALLCGNNEKRFVPTETVKIPHEVFNLDNNVHKETNSGNIRLNSSFSEYKVNEQKTLPQELSTRKDKDYQYISSFHKINQDEQVFARQDKPLTEENVTEEIDNERYIKVIGEVFRTYIVCESGDDLVLIDKHAAHERIRYNKLRSELNGSAQLLAESAQVRLDANEHSLLLEHADLLLGVGIDVADIGDYTIEVLSLPTLFAHQEAGGIIAEIAEQLKGGGENISDIFDETLHSIACRGAVKANDYSVPDDLKFLAETVWNDKTLRFCPHGRPIITVINKSDLEKTFGRIQ
ncbi:MAG: DNA mismatch repair endonuclease MutL [Oscillospiraceae bacterium]|jgi:DNA mismatch repair protein MutL|nr:DNA mismatch repair endonuclease MutL [Oscillospiraceae bacterium]